MAVLRFFNELYKETTTKPFCHPDEVKNTPVDSSNEDIIKISKWQPSLLPVQSIFKRVSFKDFNFDDAAKASIKKAHDSYLKTVKSLEMHTMINDSLTKGFCKNHKVSPDAVLQLGIQLAYFRQHGEYVGTYESCSTAAFRHGRTETIRPCTKFTKEFCDAVSSKTTKYDASILRKMIQTCSENHGKLIKEAAMGQGFDRHLFGLKHMAETHKIPVDQIYESDIYRKLNYNILSTSSLSSDGILAGSFGPVVKDGYGIGYGVQEFMLGVIFTNYAGQRNGVEFVECLRKSFDIIKNVLEDKNTRGDFYD